MLPYTSVSKVLKQGLNQMQLKTSFGQINILSKRIAEVIVNQDIEITIELVEEYDEIMNQQFTGTFAVLVNRINNYTYSYEALLCLGSAQNLRVAAVISYGASNETQTKNLYSARHMDNFNIKEFSGLELGRDDAIIWLNEQLDALENSEITQSSSRD